MLRALMLAAVVGTASAPCLADVTVTQGSTNPTYSTTLNFDEAGTPTGEVASTTWLASHGVTVQSADGVNIVDNFAASTGLPWLGEGNAFTGTFGVTLTFTHEVSELAFSAWDPSGPPTNFGGGFYVVAYHNSDVVGFGAGTPAWGGIGLTEWNVTTSGGTTFNRVEMYGNSVFPTTVADNLSWNVVPAPGSLAAFAIGGLIARRRRA